VTDGDRVEVTSGLVPGDRVVIDGADKLRDGAKINVRAEVPAGAPPAAGTPPTGGPAGDPEKSGKKRRSDSGQKQ
jgi:membrane fusion protein, multidrug efflux system